MTRKIFGIGFHKTGTTSLAAALTHLGYRVTGPNNVHGESIKDDAPALVKRLVEKFDAFQDNPWPILYRELDAWYPGSRFILTVRPTEEWLNSVVRHFGTKDTPMRKWIYGIGHPVGHEDIYVARYEQHNSEVREFFRDRPSQLLEMRLTEGDGWEKLCTFLGKPAPATAFPHANPAGNRRKAYSSGPERGGLTAVVRSLRDRIAALAGKGGSQ